ncbi:hypothetical protein B0O99DRAFT_683867 [Bisporella sp. PMI_857]|nr:hypothetical protein B0O99DRAFT_683867 [Bisporella sp. PMI_857]
MALFSHGSLRLSLQEPELYKYSSHSTARPLPILSSTFSTASFMELSFVGTLLPVAVSLSARDPKDPTPSSPSMLSGDSFQLPSVLRLKTDAAMAPAIQIPKADSLETLPSVLKRRADTSRILNERQKKVLSAEGYRPLELNLDSKAYLQLVDTKKPKQAFTTSDRSLFGMLSIA